MQKIRNTIIYLIGFPGTGKYTIAKEIADKTNFKLIDNHLINNPILRVLDLNGKSKIPTEIWNRVREIKKIVFDTIIDYSSKEANFVFTNHLVANDYRDHDVYSKVKFLAEKRDSLFIPVRLLCSVDELQKRILQPDRIKNHKLTDKERIVKIASQYKVYKPNHPNSFELDISYQNPREVSDLILKNIIDKFNLK